MEGHMDGPNNFEEMIAKSAEVKIKEAKIKNTHDNAVDLIENSSEFFGPFKEVQEDVANRVFTRFKRGYRSFGDIEVASNDSSKNKKVALADMDSLVDSVFIAMNAVARGGELVTDSLTAEQIDGYLPDSFKGIGEKIKEKGIKGIDDKVKEHLLEVNTMVDARKMLNPENVSIRGTAYEIWGKVAEKEPEDSIVRQYVEAWRTTLSNLGIKEVEENKVDGDVFEEKRERKGKRKKGDVKPIYDDKGEFMGFEGETSDWQLSAEYAAEAMKYMDSSMRWSTYTPPRWFKDLAKNPDGSVNEKGKEMQARIEYMVMVNNAAANLLYAGKDLDKIMQNKAAFGFKNRQMSLLFNEDFKFVTSKMLNDLCEFHVDQNGQESLRYKLKQVTGKNGDKKMIINEDVREHIEEVEDYEEDLAKALAKENGRTEPNYMDKMNAYTAWNLFFAMGDSSLADTMRIFPTYEGIISDALRTLNPEYKALGKMQIVKSGQVKEDEDLIEAEYFGGKVADYLLNIMKMERDLGHDEIIDGKKVHISKSIDGGKTMRQKILDGELSFLSNKMFYGFFDFVNGGRDLVEGDNRKSKNKFYDKDDESRREELSLGQLIRGYAFKEVNGEIKEIHKEERREFSFGDKTTTFMNEFHDSLEGAVMASNCLTGKEVIKDPTEWIVKFKSALGMVSGVKFNNRPAFSYAKDPEFWRDILIGSFGYDVRRISSDYVALKKPDVKPGELEQSYNLYLADLFMVDFKINNSDLDLNEVFRLLGVDVDRGENPASFGVTLRNDHFEKRERLRTIGLNEKVRKLSKYDDLPENFENLINNVAGFEQNDSPDFKRMKRDFDRAIRNRSYKNAERLYKAMEEELRK